MVITESTRKREKQIESNPELGKRSCWIATESLRNGDQAKVLCRARRAHGENRWQVRLLGIYAAVSILFRMLRRRRPYFGKRLGAIHTEVPAERASRISVAEGDAYP